MKVGYKTLASDPTGSGSDLGDIFIPKNLFTQGGLWVWGLNNSGQLATNNLTNYSSPVQTISGGTNWKQITSIGIGMSGIKTDGTLWSWGYNGYGNLGVGAKNKAETIIACWKWDKYHGDTHQYGLDVKTSSYIRIHPKSTIVDAKICGHYVNGLLALQELEDTHYHEALMLDADGYVSECSSANIFVVKDNIIYTPKLGTILPGITRDFVIKLAKDLDIKVEECNLKPTDVMNANEVFFTGTAVELTQMRSLDDVIIGNSKDYPIFNQLKDEFQKTVRGCNHKYNHYLTYVN